MAATRQYGSHIHVCVVLLASSSDWSLSIANFDDADDEYDEYDDSDTFGDYNAHTLAEIDHVEQEAFAIGEYIWFMYVEYTLPQVYPPFNN